MLGARQGDRGVKGFLRFKRTFSIWDGFPPTKKYKFLLLRQVLSGLLGTTAVGPNVNITAQQIRQNLVEFGVSGSDGPPIDIRTDAATDVGENFYTSVSDQSGVHNVSSRSPGTQCDWFC